MTTTALLVMDVHQGIVDRFPGDAAYLPRLRRAIDAARTAGIRVIYVTVRFRPGHPEISPRNKGFTALAQAGGTKFDEGDPACSPASPPAASCSPRCGRPPISTTG